MTNRVLDGASVSDLVIGSGEGTDNDSFRRVADIPDTRGRGDIWSEPEVKLTAETDEEREAATSGVPLEDEEGIGDPVRIYLDEIGKVHLLSAADEKRLGRQMEEGQHIEAIELAWVEEQGVQPTAVETTLTLFEQLAITKPVLDVAVKRLKLPKQSTLSDRLGDPVLRSLIDAEMDLEFMERVASERKIAPAPVEFESVQA